MTTTPRPQDIAIVGIACRLPSANSPEEFWSNLCAGTDCIRELDRWDSEVYGGDAPKPGRSVSKWGGTLDDPFGFDASFFRISKREEDALDPQQRMLLEEAWHCIEDSGVGLAELQARPTGVFVGVMAQDYQRRLLRQGAVVDAYTGSGNYGCMLANRVSYTLGLSGESKTVDTACSASLYALHDARRALSAGECRYALLGAASLILDPLRYVAFSNARMLSPDGHCKTFDARANGYVPGEGAVVFLLERYEDAVRAGHDIRAVIRGSAVNHGGAANSLTAPRVAAQYAVLKQAYTAANIAPHQVSYIEAHGTGTSLGDPIEIEALNRALLADTDERQFCALGAVKSNIGHLEGAAGLAGLLKVVLMLQHRAIPKTLHIEQPNPVVELARTAFRLSTELSPWSVSAERPQRIAGVSSFGFGGANAHVVVSEPPTEVRADTDRGPRLVVLSAKTPAALQALAERWQGYLARTSEPPSLTDLSMTSLLGRTHHPLRIGAVVHDMSELADALQRGTEAEPMAPRDQPLDLFLPGDIRRIADLPFTERPSDEPAHTERALFEKAVANVRRTLAALAPRHVVGQGAGLWVALAATDALGVDQAFQYVGRPANEARCSRPTHEVVDAAQDASLSPFRVAAAEQTDLVENATFSAGEAGRLIARSRALLPNQATYRKFLEEWNTELARVFPEADAVAGETPDELTFRDGRSWLELLGIATCLHRLAVRWELSEPVSLSSGAAIRLSKALALKMLSLNQLRDVLDGRPSELNPRPADEAQGKEWMRAAIWSNAAAWRPLRAVEEGSPLSLEELTLERLLELWLSGHEVRFEPLFADVVHRRVALPVYPFERPAATKLASRAAAPKAVENPAPRAVERPTPAPATITLRSTDPLVADHRIRGRVVVAATEILTQLMSHAPGTFPLVARDFRIERPLLVDGEHAVQVIEDGDSLRLADASSGYARCAVSSVPERGTQALPPEHALTSALSVDALFEQLSRRGYHYGRAFRRIVTMRASADALEAQLSAPSSNGTALDSRLLDGVLQVLLAAADHWSLIDFGERLLLPVSIRSCTVHSPLTQTCIVRVERNALRALGQDFFGTAGVYSLEGRSLAELEGVLFKEVPADFLGGTEMASTQDTQDGFIYEPLWQATRGAARERSQVPAVIVADLPEELVSPSTLDSIAGHHERSTRCALGELESVVASFAEGSGELRVYVTFGEPGADASELSGAVIRLLAVQRAVLRQPALRVSVVALSVGAHAISARDGLSRFWLAGIAGAGASLARESGRLRFAAVDFEPRSGTLPAGMDGLGAGQSAVYAVRGEQVFVRSFARTRSVRSRRQLPLMRGDAVVVTGGAGGIAKHLRSWLEPLGIRIALLGRRTRSAVGESEAVRYYPCDIASRSSLESTLQRVRHELGEIVGVFHAAGVLRDGVGLTKSADDVHDVLHPKLQGTLELDRATRTDPLRFFVCFGSVVGLVGNAGQSDYAAANAFQDAFTAWRLRQSAPGQSLCVNWTLWSGGGMGLSEAVTRHFRAMGLPPITPARAISILEELLSHVSGSRAVCGEPAPLLETESPSIARASDRNEVTQKGSPMVSQFEQTVRSVIAEVVGVAPGEVAGDRDFRDYGVDSVAITLIAERLTEVLSAQVLPNVVIEHPTLQGLARALSALPSVASSPGTLQAAPPGATPGSAQTAEPPHPPPALLREEIRRFVGETLGLSSADLDDDRDLRDYGVDSVGITILAEKLSEGLGVAVLPSTIIECPSIARLAQELAQVAPVKARALGPTAEASSAFHQPPPPPASMSAPSAASPALTSASTNDPVLATVRRALAQTLGLQEALIEADRDFRDYGIDSVAITILAETLSVALAVEVLPNTVIEQPTVTRLAEALARRRDEATTFTRVRAASEGVSTAPRAAQKGPGAEPSEAEAASLASTGGDVRRILAETLGLPESAIEADRDFREYGIDSVSITILAERLSSALDVEVLPQTVIEHPTLDKLSAILLGQRSPTRRPESAPKNTVTHHPSHGANGKVNGHAGAWLPEGLLPRAAPEMAVNSPERAARPSLSSATRVDTEPHWVAIVAAAGRFPGSDRLEQFWENLSRGRDLVQRVPVSRIDLDKVYSAERGAPGKSYVRAAGMLADVAGFDPDFFQVGEEDACEMDPQHRIILELTQELFDRAGYTRAELKGSSTGVFVGATESNYGRKSHQRGRFMGKRGVVNSVTNLIAGRVSHFYDLSGPAAALYTACSSSLFALNQASMALASRQCDMAVAAGIELLLDDEWFVGFCASQALSPRERCRVFAEDADGIAIGEGAGCVLLKRLDDAMRDGDAILAVVEASMANNDGQTMGLTTPNMLAQKRLIARALDVGKVDPATISMFEAHGAGTPLGDPIEIKAASSAYAERTSRRGYCAIGSVKSNIGHLLSAAGMASLVKVLLSMQHKLIPASLHCENPHPRYEFEATPFTPNRALTRWEPIDGIYRAAISSFGFGGTNVHVILRDLASELDYHPTRVALPLTRFNRRRCWLPEKAPHREDAPMPADALERLFERVRRGEISVQHAERAVVHIL